MSKQKEDVHFSVGEMFEQAFINHTEEEMEQYWGVGAPGNIPSIDNLPSEGPRPWMFIRILGLCIAVFLVLLFAWWKFHNTNFLPGLIFVGSSIVPISLVILFFELNVRRNISMYLTIKMLFLGGVLSLLLCLVNGVIAKLFGFNMDWMGDMSAGPLEETAKLLVVICILGNRRRYPYILNGLLLGAAVGAGFSLFESAGYSFRALIKEVLHLVVNNIEAITPYIQNEMKEASSMGLGSLAGLDKALEIILMQMATHSDMAMLTDIVIRGVLEAFAGHTIWTALNAAALWRVKGTEEFKLSHLCDIRFFIFFLCTVGFHMLNNSGWNPQTFTPFDKYIILGVLGWAMVFWMVRQGVKQIQEKSLQTNGEQEITQVIQTQTDYVRKLVSVKLTDEESRVEIEDQRRRPLPEPPKTDKPTAINLPNPSNASGRKPDWRDYYKKQ